MSAALPVKWLPDSLPIRVEAALRNMLDRWSEDWGAPKATAIRSRLLTAHDTPTMARALPWEEPSKEWSCALARALLGPAAVPGSPVVLAATQYVTSDLQTVAHRSLRMRTSSLDFTPASVGHGGVELGFELLGMQFGFALDLEELQVGEWLESAPPMKLQPVAFEAALRDVPVPLVAQLGHATISVPDVLQLQPGDVLLLAEPLDAPLQVTSPGSSLQLSAHLGATAAPTLPTRRAMRWLAS